MNDVPGPETFGHTRREPSATSPALQAWVREVIRSSTRRGRGRAGLSVDDLEARVRQLVPDERIDFKRLRGYRSDRRPAGLSRDLIVALAEVCGADPAEPLRLFEHACSEALDAPGRAPADHEMCGREAELYACRAALERALTGRDLVTLLVRGGAGFGKTLMVRVLETDLLSSPRAEVLRVSAATGLDELESRLTGASPAGRTRARPDAVDFADQLLRRADTVRDALIARARRCATVLLVDDLHHASLPLVDLLTRLADQEVPASLAIVATARPDPRVDTLAGARTTSVVQLGPLDLNGVAEMVERRGGALAAAERAELARIVLESTEGHPAGAAMVVADHLDGSGWRPGHNVRSAAASAAQTTVERWARRIDGLPARARTVLCAAAVVGTAFDVRLLRPLPALTDIGDRVAESLEPAVEAGVARWLAGSIYEFGHELARDATLAAMRPPVRAEISHQVAAVLASPIGAAALPDPVARNAELLRHRRAALPNYDDEALPLAEVALAHGQALIAAFDDPGARDVLETGLDALRRLPPRSRPGLEGALLRWLSICPSIGTEGRRRALTEALDVLLAAPDADPAILVDVTCDYSHLPGFGTHYDPEALEKCRQVLAIVTAGASNPGLAARIEATMAFHEMWCIQGDDDQALLRATALSSSAWDHAVASRDPYVQVAVLDAKGLFLYLSPDATAMTELGSQVRALGARVSVYELIGLVRQGRRDDFERALAEADADEGFPWPDIWTHGALMLQFHGLGAFLDGDVQGAITYAQEMVDRYHDRDPNFVQVFAAAFLWGAYQAVGPGPAAEMAVAAAAERPTLAGYRAAAAFFLARSGEIDASRAVLGELLSDGLHTIRKDASWTVLVALLAETIVLTGASEYAQEVHDALLPYSGQILTMATGVFCYGSADRFLGMLGPLLAGDTEATATRFEAALDLERRLQAPALSARTLLWFARTVASDDPGWALELLEDAAAECPPQLGELRQWIAGEQAAIHRRRRPITRSR